MEVRYYVQLSLMSILLSLSVLLLTNGTAGSQILLIKSTSVPCTTGCTSNDVASKAQIINATSALPKDVLMSGKVFWGMISGFWKLISGNWEVQKTDTNLVNTKNSYSVANNVKSDISISGKTDSMIEAIGDADAADVLAGKTFSNTDKAGIRGTMSIQSLSDADAMINTGYYSATDLTMVDSDLVPTNIITGVTIFGVMGKANRGGTTVALSDTGQTTSYIFRDDGNLQIGATMPTPRFTDNFNGTITDNLTNLVWLKNASCTETLGGINPTVTSNTIAWVDAFTWVAALANTKCGLSDSSKSGDWRLPNRIELTSLLNLEYVTPALSNTAGTDKRTEGDAFTGVQISNYYLSSTTLADEASFAWYVFLGTGDVNADHKYFTGFVWPVRGGV